MPYTAVENQFSPFFASLVGLRSGVILKGIFAHSVYGLAPPPIL
jgi:hypothetical protein